MEPPSSTAAAGSSRQAMAPPGFQSASSLLKTATPVPSPGTNRNASGNLPPIPKGPSASSAPISGAVSGSNGDATAGASSSAAPKAPAKPINRPAASKNAIVYNSVQRRNPLLQSIKNVGIEIGDIAADYQVGTHNGVLFLSLKYHRLHPEYIHQRIEKIRNMYTVRIMLILCDVSEHQASLRELSKIAIINQLTVFVAWSNEEVAQYLTTFKTYEHRGGDSLKEPIHQTYTEQLAHVMTSGKKVNKTDTDNLASQFGSFANISKQPSKVLSGVKGLGATKVTSLVDAFTKPFLVGGLKRGESSSQPTNPLSAAGASRVDGPGAEVPPPAKVPSPVGSPDWPDEDPEDEEAEAPVISPSIPRDRAPSRSPGLSPEAAPLDGEGEDRAGVAVWKDPLEDDEDEDDEDEGPAPKRSRLDV